MQNKGKLYNMTMKPLVNKRKTNHSHTKAIWSHRENKENKRNTMENRRLEHGETKQSHKKTIESWVICTHIQEETRKASGKQITTIGKPNEHRENTRGKP